mgnify:CR=1 FL=1|jgi:hypothetical protein
MVKLSVNTGQIKSLLITYGTNLTIFMRKEQKNMNELENLRFNLTPKIQDLLIEMLINKQVLQEGKIEADKIELLKVHQEELKKEFTKQFRKNNVKQLKKLHKLLNK